MSRESDERIREIMAEVDAAQEEMRRVLHQLSEARGRYYRVEKSLGTRQKMESLEAEASALGVRLENLEEELKRLAGITDDVLEAIEASLIDRDEQPRVERDALTDGAIPPTRWIEDLLPDALETVREVVDPRWLKDQREASWRLDESFLLEPLSLTRGVRIASEERAIHRFAQAICVAEDFLERHPRYDFYAGALLVPQLMALGAKFDALRDVPGDTLQRIEQLWKGPASSADATTFELLVAASCVREGRQAEFLATGADKTPDLRIHDFPFPLVVECKRQAALSEYEREEEEIMRAIFAEVSGQARRLGLWGGFEIDLDVEPHLVDSAVISGAAMRQRFAPDPRVPTRYQWGQVGYRELRSPLSGPITRVYSPEFMQGVFGWNSDVPQHDGIVCQVTADDFVVDSIREPIALLWRNTSERALKKRSWTAVALYGEAAQQVPGGEVGITYVCYREGTRSDIADRRTQWIVEQLRKFWHEPSVRLPVSFLVRLYPRALKDGRPDLVESTICFKSERYGDEAYFDDFPGNVFTDL